MGLSGGIHSLSRTGICTRQSVCRVLVMVLSLVLQACATQQQHDWFTGSAAVSLEAAPTVIIERINDRTAESAFIGQVHTYQLAPGHYTIVAQYADLFELTSDDFETVRSDAVRLAFQAEPGRHYRIEHVPVKGVKAARTFAKQPELRIVDVERGEVAHSTPNGTPGMMATGSESGQTQDITASSMLTIMQVSWQNATPEERAAFLCWVKRNSILDSRECH